MSSQISPSPRRSPDRPSQLGRALLALMALLLAVLAFGLIALAAMPARRDLALRITDSLIQQLDAPVSESAQPVRFEVREGEGAQRIGERLEQQGLIRSALLFRLLAHYYGVAASLKAGEYELSSSMTTSEILERLYHGLVRFTEVTIIEGWRSEEIAESLEQAGIFPKADFLATLNGSFFDYDFLRSRPPGATLEGYLFPDTYRLAPRSRPIDLVDQMLRNFDRRFNTALRQQAAARGLTIHQVVTLASIVEREAVVPDERPRIAAVFLNRLRLSMRLDADPTVQYALGSDPQSVAQFGYWKKRLTEEDLTVDSPYNTYRYPGLPPGPIANPGLASIKAVLEPANTEDLYFVAIGDGSHAFARTLEEHLANVQRYRR